MPRFLLPIVVLSFVFLSGLGYVILNLSPDQTISVILFLVTFFLSILSVSSVLLFFIHKKFFFKSKTFTAFGPLVTDDDLRSIFRTSLRNAFLISALATALLVFRRLW